MVGCGLEESEVGWEEVVVKGKVVGREVAEGKVVGREVAEGKVAAILVAQDIGSGAYMEEI